MTEEHGRYTLQPERRKHDDVEPIGDILRQFVDEQGWDRSLLPPLPDEPRVVRSPNGQRHHG